MNSRATSFARTTLAIGTFLAVVACLTLATAVTADSGRLLAQDSEVEVSDPPIQNNPNPAQYTWPSATGSLLTVSGEVWVIGNGSLSLPTANQNAWRTAWYGHTMTGTITAEPNKRWILDAACHMNLHCTGNGNDSWGWDDNYRAETTGSVEIKGDFNGFHNKEIAVDTYTTPQDWTNYAVLGGGANPSLYTGQWRVKAAPGSDSSLVFVWMYNKVKNGGLVDFFIYTESKQYMFAHGGNSYCEDTNLTTTISSYESDSEGNPIFGWNGTLTSYYWDASKGPSGDWAKIHKYKIPSGDEMPDDD